MKLREIVSTAFRVWTDLDDGVRQTSTIAPVESAERQIREVHGDPALAKGCVQRQPGEDVEPSTSASEEHTVACSESLEEREGPEIHDSIVAEPRAMVAPRHGANLDA